MLSLVGDSPIVSNLGPTTDELWHAGHRDRNFYTYGAMGLCSSIALGVALSTGEKVISLDGDGSMLMNLGGVATVGREYPDNLVIIVWDNQEWGQTGHQPSHTAVRTDLEQVAQSCGIIQTAYGARGRGLGACAEDRAGDSWPLVHCRQGGGSGVYARFPHRAGNDSLPVS